jgi:hypothetical protein
MVDYAKVVPIGWPCVSAYMYREKQQTDSAQKGDLARGGGGRAKWYLLESDGVDFLQARRGANEGAAPGVGSRCAGAAWRESSAVQIQTTDFDQRQRSPL